MVTLRCTTSQGHGSKVYQLSSMFKGEGMSQGSKVKDQISEVHSQRFKSGKVQISKFRITECKYQGKYSKVQIRESKYRETFTKKVRISVP